MKSNVGATDRTLRIVAGVILLGLFFLVSAPWHWLGLIGVVPLATGLVRWCPAYAIFGVDTCNSTGQGA